MCSRIRDLGETAKRVFIKYQCDILKRVFSVEGDGTCVRASVAENALFDAIKELEKHYTKSLCSEQ